MEIFGSFYHTNTPFQLIAYSDADWGTCKDTRKSLTGFCIFLGKDLVAWRCKKQSTVSASSAEAEYRALSSTTRELIWFAQLFQDFSLPLPLPISLMCDNHAAIHISKNAVFHEKTKHIEIDCHIVRERYQRGFLVPTAVSSRAQLADFFTKPHCGPRFHELLSKMGLLDLHQLHLAGGV